MRLRPRKDNVFDTMRKQKLYRIHVLVWRQMSEQEQNEYRMLATAGVLDDKRGLRVMNQTQLDQLRMFVRDMEERYAE